MKYIIAFVLLDILLNFKIVGCFPARQSDEEVNIKLMEPYDMPSSCEGKKYCTDKGDEYPEEDVDILMNKISKNNVNLMNNYNKDDETVEHPIRDSESECTAKYKSATIYYVLDGNKKTQAVVQSSKGNFSQKFDIRECHETINKSRYILNTSGVEMSCETKYMLFDFYVLSFLGEEVEMEVIEAELPVCCLCRYDKNDEKNRESDKLQEYALA